jgi:hypothetical protein
MSERAGGGVRARERAGTIRAEIILQGNGVLTFIFDRGTLNSSRVLANNG